MSGPTLFVSDLHLTPERPAQAQLFHDFLRHQARHSAALYILGDLYEAWVGDDDLDTPFNASVAAGIRQLVQSGVSVFFMPGNRDFLAGPALAKATGWVQLPDPTRIELHGVATLLSHGDAYCTDDLAYQTFRQQVRAPAWQVGFLSKPLPERHALALALRQQSEQSKAEKKPTIMDVNTEAIRQALREARATRLIHGHTHRPAKHLLQVDGVACERWVLPAWYEGGGYLACGATGCNALPYP